MRSIVKSPFFRRAVVAVIATVVILVIAVVSYTSRSQAAPQQPMPFPHNKMVQAGVQCVFCHTDATKSPSPGMPSVEKCMGCHKFVATNTPAIQQLAAYWQRQEPVPWVRINQLPRYVHFPHNVHVNSGINCERCHGDVGQMPVTHQVAVMNMGWCLSCHQQQPNAKQLIDCVICHY
jgi:hypothetical protein